MDYIVTDCNNREVKRIFIPDFVYLHIKSYLFKTNERIQMDKVINQITGIIKKAYVVKSLDLNNSERFIWNNWGLNKKIKYMEHYGKL